MTKYRWMIALAVTAAAVPMTTALAGSATDRATGGGQILVSTDGGAGDTIAFTAQGTAEAARGQVQYVDREGGTGIGQTVSHGTVQCLEVEGNRAEIVGTWTDRDGGGEFQLVVVDNGEGAAAQNDIIALTEQDDPQCGDDDDNDDDGDIELARGNAQVYDAG